MLKSRLDAERVDEMLSAFSRLGLHPNLWSLIALMLAFLGFVSLLAHKLPAAILFFVLSGFIDMVDGAVARTTGAESTLGAFLDGILDRYVEVLLILGLMVYLGEGVDLLIPVKFWIVLLVFGSVMTSFVRAYADHRGLVKDEQKLKEMGGVLERAERLILLYIGMIGGIYSQLWLVACIMLAAILSNATAVQRIFLAIRYGKRLL